MNAEAAENVEELKSTRRRLLKPLKFHASRVAGAGSAHAVAAVITARPDAATKTHRSATTKFARLMIATDTTLAATGRIPSRPTNSAMRRTLPVMDAAAVDALNLTNRTNPWSRANPANLSLHVHHWCQRKLWMIADSTATIVAGNHDQPA